MKVYVASHCRDAALRVASVLSTAGHEITSRWLNSEFKPTKEHSEHECIEIAQEDFDDVAAADALVLVAGPDRYSGGKFVETGIALGMGKRVIVIGRRENMLIWLPTVQQVPDAESAAIRLSLCCESLAGDPAISLTEHVFLGAGELEALDWVHLAKLAGTHGIRYATNQGLVDFLAALGSAPVSQKEAVPVGEQWRALEDGSPKTSWYCEKQGDRAGWDALARRNPATYQIETRALYASPAPAGEPVGIKALEWVATHDGDWLRAESIGLVYEIRNDEVADYKKAQCQVDFETRIRSALHPIPTPVSAPVGKSDR